jgi:hypothetical protein
MEDLDCRNESLDGLKRWPRDIEVGRSKAAKLAALWNRANKIVYNGPKYGLLASLDFGQSGLSSKYRGNLGTC